MSRRRHLLSFTERRRASLAKKVAQLDRLETRNTITEPISVLGLSMSAMRGLGQLGIVSPFATSNELNGPNIRDRAQARGATAPPTPAAFLPITIGAPPAHAPNGGGGGSPATPEPVTPAQPKFLAGELLGLSAASDTEPEPTGISLPWHPARSALAGGGAMPPRGGSGASNVSASPAHGAATSAVNLPASTPAASAPASPAPHLTPSVSHPGQPGALPSHSASAPAGGGGGGGGNGDSGGGGGGAGDAGGAGSNSGPVVPGIGMTPDPVLNNISGPSQNSFPYFPVYVFDVNHAVVLMPGVTQLALPGRSVYLQAQVSGTTVSSYNWDTSGISADAGGITGATTYQLSFNWNTSLTAHVDPVTLAVTDSNSHTETYTYDFQTILGGGSILGGEATYAGSYAPDTVSPDDPAWASDGVSVDSNSGSLDTSINLPSYNPAIAQISLDYDSLSANPLPIIIADNTLSGSQAVPSQVSATLESDHDN